VPQAFYAEVRRVTRPGGFLAVWCYESQAVSPEVDAVFEHLFWKTLGPYWLPQRRLVDDKFKRPLPWYVPRQGPLLFLVTFW
jgi:hypothetical protein